MRTGPGQLGKAWTAMVAAVLLLASPTRAQDMGATAQLSASRAYIGDAVTLQITVSGASEAAAPDLSGIEGVRAEYVGGQDTSSQSVTIVNGRRTERVSRSYIMQYRLTPTRAGRIEIPPIEVVVNGTAHRTNAVTLTALEPGESDDYALRAELDKPRAYVGEPIRLTLTWSLRKPARAPRLSGPDGGNEYDIYEGPDPRPPGTAQDDQRFPVLEFLGGRAVARMGQGTLGGERVTTVTIERVIVPRRAGTLRIGPYSAAFDAVVGQRAPTFFDSPFDDRSITERTVIASKPVELDVREVPTEGQPENFDGLVGEFSLSASAGASEASVGDPIGLTVRITGPEPLDRVTPPDLAKQAGFEDFKLSPEGWQAGKGERAGERVFTTTIRPRHGRVKEIPAIVMPYFDTRSGTYSGAASRAMPLVVRSAREVTSADAIGAAAAPVSAAQATITSLAPGVRANYEGADVLRDERTPLLGMVREPGWAALLVGPPLLFGAIALARARGPETPERRRARAMARARRSLRPGADAARIAGAIREYVGAASGIRPEAVTSEDLRRLMARVGATADRGTGTRDHRKREDSAERVAAMLLACESAGFGGPTPPPNAAEALAALREVDAALSGGRP
ncbi:MAG: BatD family protein [Phycisphaerae bacterium]|nr:BatD family protein [Phycisphaerae bacterium]